MQAKDFDFDRKVVPFDKVVTEKLPPHSVSLEEAVAGGLLSDPGAISRISDKATEEDFYCESYRLIFRAALDLYNNRRTCDAISIMQWLEQRRLIDQVGGQTGILNLMEQTVSAVNIDFYVQDLNTLRVRRQLIQAAQRQIGFAQNPDLGIQEIVSKSSTALTQAAYGHTATRGRSVAEVCKAIQAEFENGVAQGIPTGLYDLDRLIGGLQPEELLIFAGASGMGKTQIAAYLTYTVAAQGYPVMFFSCEMSDIRIADRLLAHIATVDSNMIHQRNLHPEEMERVGTAREILSALPIRFCDERRLTPAIMRAELNECASQFGKPGLVILDYLQLLGGGNANRVQELDQITKECRAIAQEFNVNFLALAQINRAVTNRNSKEPVLADLRESGGIEQSADRVILLYRDEYYNPQSESRGKIKLIVAKNRYNSVGAVELLFLPQFSQFKNLHNSNAGYEPPAPKRQNVVQQKPYMPSYEAVTVEGFSVGDWVVTDYSEYDDQSRRELDASIPEGSTGQVLAVEEDRALGETMIKVGLDQGAVRFAVDQIKRVNQ